MSFSWNRAKFATGATAQIVGRTPRSARAAQDPFLFCDTILIPAQAGCHPTKSKTESQDFETQDQDRVTLQEEH
jgi:hypothetical protein